MFHWVNSLQDECFAPLLHFPCCVSAGKQAFFFSPLAKLWQPFQNRSPTCSVLRWQFAWDSLVSSSSVYFENLLSQSAVNTGMFRPRKGVYWILETFPSGLAGYECCGLVSQMMIPESLSITSRNWVHSLSKFTWSTSKCVARPSISFSP